MGVKWQKGKGPQQGKLTCGTGVTLVSCSHQRTKDVGWKRTLATGWQLLKHLGRLLAVHYLEDTASPSCACGTVWSAGTPPLWLPTLGHHYRHLKISVISFPSQNLSSMNPGTALVLPASPTTENVRWSPVLNGVSPHYSWAVHLHVCVLAKICPLPPESIPMALH